MLIRPFYTCPSVSTSQPLALSWSATGRARLGLVLAGIIAVGLVTASTHSGWPDLITGLGIAAMNADAAREVWKAAREERSAADSQT